jgi:hypothetical protein
MASHKFVKILIATEPEKVMRRFKSARQLQRFTHVHGQVSNLGNCLPFLLILHRLPNKLTIALPTLIALLVRLPNNLTVPYRLPSIHM